MDREIKKPSLDRPKFFDEAFDYRNIEYVGPFCGVGEAGKVGSNKTTSLNPMPDSSGKMYVPRDHNG